jgi:hypothetical protein
MKDVKIIAGTKIVVADVRYLKHDIVASRIEVKQEIIKVLEKNKASVEIIKQVKDIPC